MYFRNAKIFGEFVGAQGVDVGIDPYAQFGKLQIKTQKTRCMICCPLTGVTTLAGVTRLVFRAPAGFSIGV